MQKFQSRDKNDQYCTYYSNVASNANTTRTKSIYPWKIDAYLFFTFRFKRYLPPALFGFIAHMHKQIVLLINGCGQIGGIHAVCRLRDNARFSATFAAGNDFIQMNRKETFCFLSASTYYSVKYTIKPSEVTYLVWFMRVFRTYDCQNFAEVLLEGRHVQSGRVLRQFAQILGKRARQCLQLTPRLRVLPTNQFDDGRC